MKWAHNPAQERAAEEHKHATRRAYVLSSVDCEYCQSEWGKQLSGKKERNLIINAECIRLIANMIIYHNAKILSVLYEYYTAKDPEKSLEIIHWSPVAWRFVNLIGNYEFYRKDKNINIHEVIDKLIASFEIDFLSESLE